MSIQVLYERARLCHAREIHAVVRVSAEAGQMLPRALSELYESVRDFVVALDPDTRQVIGCCALHVIWEDLGEVRSLAVAHAWRGHGIGRHLVELCLADARDLCLPRVFALTYVPDFFKKLGFEDISKDQLPHKVWSDCIRCHKFPDCDEQAVARSIAGPAA